jgi:HD superfamily phosphohydrolase
MDYLYRDSLHAGVPYGQHFDQQRLIGSLCLNEAGDGLAITDKGRTAAEMMVFARYVMFSEVYWHHAVRAATAMLQRAFYLLYSELDLDSLFRLNEQQMVDQLQIAAAAKPAAQLLHGLFGPSRALYKRLAQYSFFQQNQVYQQLARRPYPWLVACGDALAQAVSRRLGRRIAPHEILFDAPPVQLEIEFQIDVYFPKEDCYRPLGNVSPVVQTLAQKQFDDYVKRVRIFAHPDVVEDVRRAGKLSELLAEAIERTG